MTRVLAENPVLLLFVVAGTGFLLGRVPIGGFRLGVAAVLFAGIAFGGIDERFRLPEAVWALGLAVFVYTVGVSAGPGFVAALRRRGVPANAVVLGGIALGAVTSVVVARLALGVETPVSGGAFAGGLTNTPALAAILEHLRNHVSADTFERIGNDPVVGYSLAYPLGVLIPLVASFFLLRRPNDSHDTVHARTNGREPIVCRTVEVTRGQTPCLGELRHWHGGTVNFSRIKQDGTVRVATSALVPSRGDLLSVVGAEEDVRRLVDHLGVPSTEHLALDRAELDFRRFFVSNRAVAGVRIADLDLPARFGAKITRVRRGDVDMVATPDTTLELGDRVRVVGPQRCFHQLGRELGDSYRSLSELDVMTFSVGIALGLLLGEIPIPIPGLGTFTLGSAGGPLLVGIVLGALVRTGPLVWQLPYSASLTLRQFGMVLFLAGVGTRAGQAFADTIAGGDALPVLVGGAAITVVPLAALLAAGRLMRVPRATLVGMLAGMQTQPAVLAFATERVDDDTEVNRAYATVYPAAMIAKIVIAQLLVA
jgi:putative transport protein